MKKLLLVYSAIILILFGSGYSWYISNYEGPHYYVYIRDDNNQIRKKQLLIKREVTQYSYVFIGYNEKGEKKELKLSTFEKIKTNTYVEVFPNKNDEVITTIERKRSEVPRTVFECLE